MTNPITKIWVEAVGASFQVVLMNSRKQTLHIGDVKPLQLALTDAHELADYFGIKATPFRDSKMRVIPPIVVRDTYDAEKIRTQAEIIREYRLPTGELNWNKIMHYEWSKFRQQASGGFADKRDLMHWLLPFKAAGPTEPEAVEAAKEWLKTQTNGAWLPTKGGIYMFSDDRDSSLFKMFHH